MEDWETWTKDELENQMSPSRWNPTKTADEVVSQHISALTEGTLKARQRIHHKLDISYGASDQQKYDMYGTDLPDNAPIVFWIHGGYWQGSMMCFYCKIIDNKRLLTPTNKGSKDISGGLAENLYAHGVKTIVLGYTLAPKVTVRQIQDEFYDALVQSMQEHKEASFIIAGHSAGAQLAASLLYENIENLDKNDAKRIVGFLLFAGIFDLRPLVPTYVNEALRLTRNEAEELSPLLQPCRWTNPSVSVLLCVGGFDSPEFQRQSTAYALKLGTACDNVQLRVCPTDDHFTLVEMLSSSSDSSSGVYVLNFLKSIGFIK